MPADPAAICPRWHTCSAPLCPLDPDMARRTYEPDEPLCSLPWPQVAELLAQQGRTLTRSQAVDIHERAGATSPLPWRMAAREVARKWALVTPAFAGAGLSNGALVDCEHVQRGNAG